MGGVGTSILRERPTRLISARPSCQEPHDPQQLVDLEQNWSREAKDAIRTLKKFLSDNFGTLRPGLTTTATKFIKGVTDFNLEAFGFAAGLSRSPHTAQPLTPALLDKLIELLGVVTKERGIILALDKLDDSWDGSTEYILC